MIGVRRFFASLVIFGLTVNMVGVGALSIKSAYTPTGRIIEKEGQRILQLSGSYYQMGYDQGYLIGNDIMLMIERYLIDRLLSGNVSGWSSALELTRTKMNFGRYNDEILGMYDGMIAAGTDMRIDALGRDLTADDLKLWNTMYDVGLLSLACTSFAVWGPPAGDFSVLQARNMDFPYDTVNGYAANKQLLIAYSPTGKQQYAAVSWPGFIGPGTGMNQSGLALTTNVGDGAIDTQYAASEYTPSGLIVRQSLEDAAGTGDLLSQVFDIVVSHPRTRSFILQISQPLARGPQTSEVIEADSNGQEVRVANPTDPYVFAANHFVQRTTSTPSQNNTLQRQAIMTARLPELVSTGDNKVDLAEAQSLLGELANANSWPTLLSVYLRPSSLSFDIAYARTVGQNPVQVTEAPFVNPVSYTWAEVFNSDPLPTPTPTTVPTPTETPTPTPIIPTATPTVVPTPTIIPTPTPIVIPTPTPIVVPTPTPTVSPIPVTVTFPVTGSSDDVHQQGSTGYLTSTTWRLGGDTTQYAGARFTGVNIPQNSTILNANVEVYATSTQWISMQYEIYAENVGDSLTFSAAALPSTRTATTARNTYSGNTRWTANTWYQLQPVTASVQEVVKRLDWTSGNSLSIVMRGTGGVYGRKSVRSFDGNAQQAPRLVVEYLPSSGPTPTPIPTPLPTPTPVPPTPTPIPPTPTPTVIPTPTPIPPTPTPIPPTPTPTPEPTPIPTPLPTPTPVPPTPTPIPPTPTPTVMPTPTPTPIPTPTPTEIPTPTPTVMPTPTPTEIPTPTPTEVPTPTPTPIPTPTVMPTPTPTPIPTPTPTVMPTPTPIPSSRAIRIVSRPNNATQTYTVFDGIVEAGGVATEVNSSRFTYSTGWSLIPNSGRNASLAEATTLADRTISFTTTSSTLAIMVARHPQIGTFEVYVDNVLRLTYNGYSPTFQYVDVSVPL